MPLHDYESLDEEDFYGQEFRREGVVSVWVGVSGPPEEPEEIDVLQDLCGVGYYNLDDNEADHRDYQLTPLKELLSCLSYVESFTDSAVEAAKKLGIEQARWVVVQYDFAYDPRRVKRPISDDPMFIGAFPYSTAQA